MLYSEEMTQVELVVPEWDMLAVTRKLAEEGVFHQIESVAHIDPQTGFKPIESWRLEATGFTALERRILSVMHNLGVEEGAPPVGVVADMMKVEEVGSSVQHLEAETQALLDEASKEQLNLEQLQNYVLQLQLIRDMGVDISALGNPHYIWSMLGTMPTRNMSRFETALGRVPFVLLTLRTLRRESVVWLLGSQENAEVLERAARSAYLNPLKLPDTYHGTPEEIIQRLHTDMREGEERLAENRAVMTELRDAREKELLDLLWRVRASQTLSDAMARSSQLRYTSYLVGWVPVARLQDLTNKLRATSDAIVIRAKAFSRHDLEEAVPVSLDNPSLMQPFEQLVTLYGQPLYQEIDPTFLIAMSFPLLFGVMFGDVGHSLLLALLGAVLASGKVRALKSMANLGKVIVACGVLGILFGFLYGSVFGDESILTPLWLNPLQSITQILIATVAVGIALLTIGFTISIINAWGARDWGRFLFGQRGIAGLLFFWSLVALGATALLSVTFLPVPLFLGLAAISGVLMLFSEPLGRLIKREHPAVEGGLVNYAVSAFFELVESTISFLSNSLSYIRLGAFAVAHGGLSAVVFLMAALVGPAGSVGYWVVVVLGTLFIVGFEGLVVAIQSLRLEYYEFFSKFFAGGGLRYTPLTLFGKTSR